MPAWTGGTARASGHVFICYSHQADQEYVKQLATFLARQGIAAWFDQEIITGYRWDQVIREKIDTCAAVVVVMTTSRRWA
jgi:hypothetical protein